MHNPLYPSPEFSSSSCIHLGFIMIVKTALPPVAMRVTVDSSLLNKGTLVWLPAPAHHPPLVLSLAYYVSELGSALPRQSMGK